jgi:hypothetical protein
MMTDMESDSTTTSHDLAEPRPQARWLRYAPPVAALSVAFCLQTVAVTDTVGTALAATETGTGIGADPRVWYLLAGLLGVAVATSIEAGAAYLMALYDRHLRARDSVWQLRLGMIGYVAVSAAVIHWWLGTRGLPQMVAWMLAGMSASALWLWSRGSRWAQRQEMIEAGQIDPALPRLPTVAKVLHPIRWIATVWLISWEPVTTTDQARARYRHWAATRRFFPRHRPVPVDAQPAGTGPGRNGSNGRTDTDLVGAICERGWQSESLNFLAAQLHVSKSRATRLRELAATRPAAPTPMPLSR